MSEPTYIPVEVSMSKQNDDSLLDVHAACAFMNISKTTLYKLIREGSVPFIRYSSRGKFYFYLDQLKRIGRGEDEDE